MKIRILFLAIAILLPVVLAPACADRNILTPTGDTLGTGRFRLEAVAEADETDNRLIWAAIGLPRFEVEGQRTETKAGFKEDTINVQAALLPQTTLTPAVGIGVIDVTDEIDRGLYVAVSKNVPFSDVLPLPIRDIRLTAGLGSGPISGLFAGAEATMMGFRLQTEFDGDDFNLAVGFPLLGVATAKALWIKDDFFIGLEIRPRF